MVLIRLLAVLVSCVLFWIAGAPEFRDGTDPEGSVTQRSAGALDHLARELSLARRAGDVTRVRELERLLLQSLPTLPEQPSSEPPTVISPASGGATSSLLKADNVTIFTGQLGSYSRRQIAVASDTVGGIYVALNALDTLGITSLKFYKSTDEGQSWSFLGGRRASAGSPFLSLDMCVTDSSDGTWLIAYVFIQNADAMATQGGSLIWGAMLNDGTHHRVKTIASKTTSRSFRNPTICTDGSAYDPDETYFYVAAEYLTPSAVTTRGLIVTKTTDLGTTWSALDTSICGNHETTPAIGINCGSTPDSLCIAFSYDTAPDRRIGFALSSFTLSGTWDTHLIHDTSNYDDYDPCLAIDPATDDVVITYTSDRGVSNGLDAVNIYSGNFLKTFSISTIATGSGDQHLTSVSHALSGGIHRWRVAYRTSAGSDAILGKSVTNSNPTFYWAKPYVVSQCEPSSVIAPVVGFYKTGGTMYQGFSVYAGNGADVYFDTTSVLVELPEVSPWGDDVRMFMGDLCSASKRQIAVASDTVGGIYVALNSQDTSGTTILKFYRSDDEGQHWTTIGGLRSSAGAPFLSLDMCVTDSSSGTWLLAYTFIQNADDQATAGGSLRWGAMLSDGTHHRWGTIASRSSATSFRNPSICTNGASYAPSTTHFYVAADFVTPSIGIGRGLAVARTTNWGSTWSAIDSSISEENEATPVIRVNCGTSPDSLCIAFACSTAYGRSIGFSRNTCSFTSPWDTYYPGVDTASRDDYDPSMAVDPLTGNVIITYTRETDTPYGREARYYYSRNFLNTISHGTIATGSGDQDLTSVSHALSDGLHCWRVAYRSTADSSVIRSKIITNDLSGFSSTPSELVSEFRPSSTVPPAVGFHKTGGSTSTSHCIYAGYGPANVYYDDISLTVDVPDVHEVPGGFVLWQNYPNPFNPTTTIRYSVAGVVAPSGAILSGVEGPAASGQQSAVSNVKLAVYDLLGREVAVLVDEQKQSGEYTATWDARGMASGVYFYRLTVGRACETKKMLLLR